MIGVLGGVLAHSFDAFEAVRRVLASSDKNWAKEGIKV